MRRHLVIGITWIVLMGVMVSTTMADETHRFTLEIDASLNGVSLPAGNYKLQLNGSQEAEIYKGKQVMTRIRVHRLSLDCTVPQSVLISRGKLKEVRLREERVVFVDSLLKAEN